MYRDYLTTVELIKTNIKQEFWEEELCQVLDGERSTQIERIGSTIGYFENLLRYSPTALTSRLLLTRALINSTKIFQFDDVIGNIDNSTKVNKICGLIGLLTYFNRKEESGIRLVIEGFLEFQKGKDIYKNLNFIRLFNYILFMVKEFVPENFIYDEAVSKTSNYAFLSDFFELLKKYLFFSTGELFEKSLIFILKYSYKIEFNDQVLMKVSSDESILEALIAEYKKEALKFEEALLSIYKKTGNKKHFLSKLEEFEVDNIKIRKFKLDSEGERQRELLKMFMNKDVKNLAEQDRKNITEEKISTFRKNVDADIVE